MKKLTFKNLENGELTTYVVITYLATKDGIYAKALDYQWSYIGKGLILWSVE